MVSKAAARSQNITGARAKKGRRLSFLLLSTVLCGMPPVVATEANAQQAATEAVAFRIPAQPLAQAIDAFIRQSGWQISYSSDIVRGRVPLP